MTGKCDRYTAAGGVVVHDQCVLVLRRPSLGEIRLPKGHVQDGESVQEAALRETTEETGCTHLTVEADLGTQLVEFDHQGRHVVRTERCFLMALAPNSTVSPDLSEKQFDPVWLAWEEAVCQLTFAAERNWVERARKKAMDLGGQGEGRVGERGARAGLGGE
ncbi:MAG: NUDIX domain-containing protein [Gemmatimonadales bacterium]